MSETESRSVGTCEVCGGDIRQRWVITPTAGNAPPDRTANRGRHVITDDDNPAE